MTTVAQAVAQTATKTATKMTKAGLLLTACLTVAAGCGSSTAGSSISSACTDVANARCNQASECSLSDGQTGTGFNILENYGSKATCVARQTLNCTNALNAPQNANNPTQVGMCVVALVGTSCTDFFDNEPPAACTPAGPRAAGASCTFNGQCASAHCNGTKGSVCGTCGDAPANGADCSGSTCANGDRCVGATTTCQPIVASGGTCDTGHPCDRGYSCVGENTKTMTPGTCGAAATTIGAPCGGTMPGCDGTRGLYCGGPSGAKTCMRVIYPGYNGKVSADGGAASATDGGGSDAGAAPTTPAGTACGQLADGSRVGCVAGDCYTATGKATGSDQGTCKPFANDGDACDTTLGPGCMYPARCVVAASGDAGGTTGTCIIPVATMCPSP
jgi:hypothetical protein